MPPLNFLSHPTAAITVIISIIFFLLSLKLLSQWRTLGRKRKFHPIGGTMLNQLFNFSRLHHYITDLARRYKTYRLIAPFRNEIYTADPANVEYILKSNFLNYGKGMYNYMNLRDLLGEGIFAVDGEKWRQQRKVSSHEFSTKVLRDFSSVVFRKNASKVAIIVSEAAVSCQTFDIQDIFMKSTLDSIFKVAFGVELGTMCGSGSNNEGAEFSNAFDTASAMSLLRYAYPFWKLKKFLNVGSEARLKEAVNIVDTFVYKLNRNELETRNSEDYSPVKKDDILSRFLQEKGVDSDLKYLRDIILNFVIAGKDTTAATLAWFIYMMCKHPHIQERVAKEIEEQTRDHIHSTQKLTANPFDEFANCTTEEQLENMHYLHATLTETLRLYPAVPVDAKICFSDDTLPDGFSMKKGDMVSYLPYAMGRMTFLWGNDAAEFKPERWIDEKGTFRPESPFKFTAFQAGPRICLGKEFAYRQMKIFSAVLLPHFVFKLSDEEKPVNYRTMINLHIDGGLHVRAFCRSRT